MDLISLRWVHLHQWNVIAGDEIIINLHYRKLEIISFFCADLVHELKKNQREDLCRPLALLSLCLLQGDGGSGN